MEVIINILEKRNLSPEEIDAIRVSFTLLLMLPVVATITGIVRHIIGLKSLSVYAPIVLTFAFYQLGYIQTETRSDFFRGVKFGLALYLIVFLSTVVGYELLKKLRMHYIPKSTLVLINVSITVILGIFLGTYIFERKGLVYLDTFSVIMIVSLSDSLTSILARKNLRTAIFVSMQTLATALLSYLIISFKDVSNLAITYTPILILILILANFYLGKFVGLRLTEYWRFREILMQATDNARQNKPNKKKQ